MSRKMFDLMLRTAENGYLPADRLLYTYSLIIALVCGTAGLPHILRFLQIPTASPPSAPRCG
jgi:Na+(H+)/acetate symporter ActP